MSIYPSAPGDLKWRFSSVCDGGACVMVARHGDSVVLGNTSQPDGPVVCIQGLNGEHFLPVPSWAIF